MTGIARVGGLVLGALALTAAATSAHAEAPATGDDDSVHATRVGGVTLVGPERYRVVSERPVLVRGVVPGQQRMQATKTILETVSAPSCGITIIDGNPFIDTGPSRRFVKGYSRIELGPGCKAVTWKHTLRMKVRKGPSSWDWVRKDQVYSKKVYADDSDVRSAHCDDRHSRDWMNDTSFSNGEIDNNMHCHAK